MMRRKFLTLTILFFLSNSLCFGGVEFDGVDDFINVTNADSLNPDLVTISFWVYFDSDPKDVNQMLLAKAEETISQGYCVYSRGISDEFQFDVGLSVSGHITAVYAMEDNMQNKWWHIAAIYTGTNAFIYLNGNKGAEEVGTATIIDWTGDLWVGRKGFERLQLDGRMNEIAIWNTNLSATDVEILCNSKVKGMPLQIKPANLVMYLPLDDEPDGTSGDGDTFVDRSGSGNDGTGYDSANNTGLTCKGEEVLSYP